MVPGVTLEELARNRLRREEGERTCARIGLVRKTGPRPGSRAAVPNAPLQRYPTSGAARGAGKILARREGPEKFSSGAPAAALASKRNFSEMTLPNTSLR